MTSNEARVAAEMPEDRPLLLFDGDCGFCRFWVAHWEARTRGRVDFAPAQREASRFPQITEEAWKRSVQVVTPDGAVYSGADAVFRLLAYAPGLSWLPAIYRHVPGARPVSEASYRLVANHRDFFSKLTWLFWGRNPKPSSYYLSRWIFLRLLGLVYAIAFLSLLVQIVGLVGAHGILPAGEFLQAVHREYGSESYRLVPTLAWISSISDAALKMLCYAGLFSGLLATFRSGDRSGPGGAGVGMPICLSRASAAPGFPSPFNGTSCCLKRASWEFFWRHGI